MSGRFEIDELVAQDSTRVVYRAHDRESGSMVALRRLLPRGHAGSGLSEDEAASFEASMRVLAEVQVPGLRRVVGWGIDPIDRLPYHACEWVEGEVLGKILNRGVLSGDAGRMMVEGALVAQVALDESGGGWQVATDPGSIIVVGGEKEFWFSFWVEAFPGPSAGSAVGGLAQLVETAMGWHGRVPSSSAGGGLASWVRMVRHERCSAAEALSALRGTPAPEREATPARPKGQPAAQPAAQSPGPPPADLSWTMPRKRNRVALWVTAASIALAIFGVGAWLISRPGSREVEPPRPMAPVGKKSKKAGEVQERQPGRPLSPRERAAEASARAARMALEAAKGSGAQPGGTFTPEQGEMLRQIRGRRVKLEGRLFKVRDSRSGKTRYLEFSDDRGLNAVCGLIKRTDDALLSLGVLKTLETRRVRISGDVDFENPTGRVVINIDKRNQIEDLGPGSGGTPAPK